MHAPALFVVVHVSSVTPVVPQAIGALHMVSEGVAPDAQ